MLTRFANRNTIDRYTCQIVRCFLLFVFVLNASTVYAVDPQINQTLQGLRGVEVAPQKNAPPALSDSTFVTMTAGSIDQYIDSGDATVYIAIDRVFSTSPTQQAVANGIMPRTVELSLSYYASEPPWCFPLHLLTINGHKLPIALPRANGQWRKLSVDVPTEYLVDLPTIPGVGNQRPIAGLQKIVVNVDTAGCHCGVEIDWAAITIKAPRPVLLVPGWTGNASTWTDFLRLLAQDGIPNQVVVLGDGLQSIPTGGFLLGSAILSALTNFGVSKVNLIAHSKGGLASRWALDNVAAAYVERLISLGSPHHGIDPLRLWIAKLNTCVLHGSSNPLVPDDCTISADEVSIDNVRAMNYTDCQLQPTPAGLPSFTGCVRIANPQGDVGYFSVVGDADMFVDNASSTYPWNASTAPYPSTPNVDLTLPGRGHYTLKAGRAELNCAMKFVVPTHYGCDVSQARQASIGVADTSVMEQLLGITDVITSATLVTVPITIDDGSSVKITAISDSPIQFRLRSPLGQPIDPLGNTLAQYRSQNGVADRSDDWINEYTLLSPDKGVWLAMIGPYENGPNPVRAVIYSTSNSGTFLDLRADQVEYLPGQSVRLEASIRQSGQILIPTGLKFDGWLRSTIPLPVTFTDSGSAGDRVAGDGVFTAILNLPNSAPATDSKWSLQVEAHALNFARLSTLDLPMRVASARIDQNQPITLTTIDFDNDQLIDALTYQPTIVVSRTGQFRLIGHLMDSNGHIVASAITSTLSMTSPLPTGRRVLTLRFEGQQIRQSRSRGPYRLGRIDLLDDSRGGQQDRLESTVLTSAYAYTDFENDPPYVAGVSEHVIDSDGNGLYNQLLLQVTLGGTNTGDYVWGGQLEDAAGGHVGWVQGHGWLQGDTSVITFAFPSAPILQNFVDGPYHLADVNLQQISGAGRSYYSTVLRNVYTTTAYQYSQFDAEIGTLPYLVNAQDRQSVADFYQSHYSVDEPEMNWEGDLAACQAGHTSSEFRSAVLDRVNYFRAMAGMPTVALSDTLNAQAQLVAGLMARNNQISHVPDASWNCYTDEAATAARQSNLYASTGTTQLVRAVDAYIADFGNSHVGHRRFLLYPPSQSIGVGDIPQTVEHARFNALYVQNLAILSSPRPTVRDGFVAWPPFGYVPYTVVFPYWSFAIADADLRDATVSMWRDGMPITLTQEPVSMPRVDNTLVWVPEGLDPNTSLFNWPAPSLGHEPVYTVKIDRVVVNGVQRQFSYSVIIIDPDAIPLMPPTATIVPTTTPLQQMPTVTPMPPNVQLRHYYLPVLVK